MCIYKTSKVEKDIIMNLFKRLDLEELEAPFEIFKVGILDRLPRPLTIEECEEKLN